MEATRREAPTNVEATGYNTDIDAHKEDNSTTLDFFAIALAQDAVDNKRDLAVLKEVLAKVGEVLSVSLTDQSCY